MPSSDRPNVTRPAASDSIWDHKPWWCQPWTIVLTGTAIPTGVWLLTHLWWLTLPLVLGVSAWWFVFLYLVPKRYAEQSQNSAS